MPLGRGKLFVFISSVESVALLVLVLRQGARCARRFVCARRSGHSLLSVLPPEKLREPIAGPPRGRDLAQLCRKLLRCRYLARTGAACRSRCTRCHSRSTSWRVRDTSCRFLSFLPESVAEVTESARL